VKFDFLQIDSRFVKGTVEVFPTFLMVKSNDLFIRGKDFYAVYDEESHLWIKDEFRLIDMIDAEIDAYVEKNFPKDGQTKVIKKYMRQADTNMIDKFHKYVQKQMRDHYHQLDERIIFENTKLSKRDYASHSLPYAMEECDISCYEKLMSTLYSPIERDKLEWSIGAIISGDSKKTQKFIVLYGQSGAGKSTVLKIIEALFDGYWTRFGAKELASVNNSFALESFRDNPLIAIQHDGDLSRIEDNTILNSLVSHESMEINEKFKSKYITKLNAFLFMGTNKPVKITEAKSGIIRRLIDVQPTGNIVSPQAEYNRLMKTIVKDELGGIAKHCLDRYNELGITYYDSYIPIRMIQATNDFYDFMETYYFEFKEKDSVTLADAYALYKAYCDNADVRYPLAQRAVGNELREYFENYSKESRVDGKHVRQLYSGFKTAKFDFNQKELIPIPNDTESWLKFNNSISLFDQIMKDYPAQYASDKETPVAKWANVKTTLSDIDTKRLHYLLGPTWLVVVDFDLKNETGEKDFGLNLKEASKWPETYAELSKSGAGIHLHYIYKGDVSKLSRIYDEDIEIKVFTGNSSLRRMLTRCNDIQIATIDESWLPLKGESTMVNWDGIKSEKMLRDLIKKALRKEINPPYTKPCINYIEHVLSQAYESSLKYDVSDLKQSVIIFAMNSSHNSDYCLKLVKNMKFQSEEILEPLPENPKEEIPIVFYDIEVFPNLFLVNWKFAGENHKVNRMINPSALDIEELLKYRLIGFNNRRYDNHILYARTMGMSNQQLYSISKRIIEGDKTAFFGNAYNLSFTDLYDLASAPNKQSLKKWEIQLHIHHQELGLSWDKPVPVERWLEVAEYCDNDVIATEAVFNAIQGDYIAREILSDLSGLSMNDTTNSQTIKILVGDIKDPQQYYIHTDLSTIFPGYEYNPKGIEKDRYKPGTKIVSGKSIYMGEDPGEGGHKIANVGMWYNVALLDVASMHPSSAIRLKIFGEVITARYEALVNARLSIKHGDYDKAKEYFQILGKDVSKYLENKDTAKALANALKTAINSVYGLTSAKFDNKLRDPKNIDNIVAKYGALFMISLKHKVAEMGYQVVHISTDSIKIAEATPEIIHFVSDYGKQFGYTFEHEATYDKMCIVNDAVYIAHEVEADGKKLEIPFWTATGKQFQRPYVFKTLFSHEPIEFYDMCETMSSQTALYLDMDANGEHDYQFVGKVGQFTPVKPNTGGGVLCREQDGKYHAATGTKKTRKKSKDESDIYYWIESEKLLEMKKEDCIDRSYYDQLANEAVEAISQYGDFEMFISDDPVPEPTPHFMRIKKTNEETVPFDEEEILPWAN